MTHGMQPRRKDRAAEQSVAAQHTACNSSRGWGQSPEETRVSGAAKLTADGVGRPLDTGETHCGKPGRVEVSFIPAKYRFYPTSLILTVLTG